MQLPAQPTSLSSPTPAHAHPALTHHAPALCRAAVLGLLVTRRLFEAGVVGEVPQYLLTCIYCAKLTMLILPEVGRLAFACWPGL